MCAFGITAIFPSQLYQNLLLSALMLPAKIRRLQTVAEIAEAIAGGEYEFVGANQ